MSENRPRRPRRDQRPREPTSYDNEGVTWGGIEFVPNITQQAYWYYPTEQEIADWHAFDQLWREAVNRIRDGTNTREDLRYQRLGRRDYPVPRQRMRWVEYPESPINLAHRHRLPLQDITSHARIAVANAINTQTVYENRDTGRHIRRVNDRATFERTGIRIPADIQRINHRPPDRQPEGVNDENASGRGLYKKKKNVFYVNGSDSD